MSSEDGPLFLVCSERSGSNLITRIIDSHPDYCGPAPLHLVRTFSRNMFRYGDLKDDHNWKIFVRDAADLINAGLGVWATVWDEGRILSGVKKRDLASVILFVYETEAAANGKGRLMIKENRIHTFLPFILSSFPEAKFLYLVRDPRDMALSWKLSSNHPGGVSKGARVWQEDQEKGIEISGFLSGAGRFLTLRYESLVSNAETEARRVCEFAGSEYSPAMLEFFRNDLTLQNAKRLKDWANLGRPLMEKNFNKYKTKLSEAEIRYTEHICGTEMEILGYPLGFPDGPGDVSALEKSVLDIEKRQFPEEQELGEEEREIRRRRLEVIGRILSRKQYRI